MIDVLAISGTNIALAVVIVAMLVGVIFGFYTAVGSGIGQRPHDGSGDAPGAKGQSETSGRDEGEEAPMDRGTR
jgi:hypothetical protein